jgi:hypothetical protein
MARHFFVMYIIITGSVVAPTGYEKQRIHGKEAWKRIGVILVKAGEN